MKIPALRAELGGRTFYMTTLTFQQVNDYVSRIDEQLHTSVALKDQIQRSINKNYISIKEYILKQPELFFNSLVLAVYDDYPEWSEIEVTYDNHSTYQLGLLNFPSHHRIFPVDGQHRVEGIKAALAENPLLASQQIAALFIGHKNDLDGMLKTRRIFTTLNRYAKPVALDDIIALDEDDEVAIITRYLLEEYDLFTGNRVFIAEQKGISPRNQQAITSIITLYQANREIFKYFYFENFGIKLTANKLITHLKFRPEDEELRLFQEYLVGFWDAFKTELKIVHDFMANNGDTEVRNNETGGNLIFRPIGFLPLVKAALQIRDKKKETFPAIFKKFNKVQMSLNKKPWIEVLWNPLEKKMLTNSDGLTQLMLINLYDPKLLGSSEKQKLALGYAAKISYSGHNVNKVLEDFK